ncbi:putative RDD family membrane protein YckC [Ulvibacter sp. MAR_2010_11]|uniref:RDD family protein n=1 Tax=Ulvibacter sp. MAR_2010_11 TaxID=1250229 RepID=UPI000C2B7AAD|nr:RDD family protein [Ulvibacter sp. MAR_2010_11]PKA83849.1 putative RDD family membrane protein YckC [Ulvibacter sp. MAR_2010_11]
MDNFQIETAQNVNISQNVAGVGERILAYLIDSAIIVIYVILIIVLFSWMDLVDDEFIFILFMTFGLPIFLYHLLWETFWNGRSPGKPAMKLRVVKMDGSKPAFSNYFIRWLLRLIDVSITSGALAVVTVLLNGKGQRLGDIAATTTVITEKKTVSFAETLLMDLPEDYKPTYPQVTVFTDHEMQTIKNVFTQAKFNGNHNIILKLSNQVAKVMDLSADETPISFLDKVIKDYTYYTRNM